MNMSILQQVRQKYDSQLLRDRWEDLYNREQSIEDWFKMVVDEQDLFWASSMLGSGAHHHWGIVGKKTRGHREPCPMPRILELNNLAYDMRWCDHVSNSHSCPHNGVTNFSGNLSKPKGYPGWSGQIYWHVEWPESWQHLHLGSMLFDSTFSRAGGRLLGKDNVIIGQKFQYQFRIFAADWPGLAAYREKRMVWDELCR